MKIIRFAAIALAALVLGACASTRPEPQFSSAAGASDQIESAQVQVGYGQSGTPDYRAILSDPGPF